MENAFNFVGKILTEFSVETLKIVLYASDVNESSPCGETEPAGNSSFSHLSLLMWKTFFLFLTNVVKGFKRARHAVRHVNIDVNATGREVACVVVLT